ncbi:ADP-ribosylglycohydrolase family protein [Desulfobacula sp.]|uniref:ADP-ribosylglycohydrolase family protein n=1 Tax=Desulfobacula sp. TaxID=2593537 RepID=UPI00261E6D7B|nr:ADP-ribosylglycohydrolase family protein [Desulfobacula sp.]
MKRSIGAKTIVYPAPVLIVATYDKDGKANAMTAAWGGICCSKPPCVTVSLRKATYSYDCIVQSKAYTLNIPSQKYVKEADYIWVAEEALAISLCCAVVAGHDFKKGVSLSVNHSVDSDSTGSITGNILGALYGLDIIPENWLMDLEHKDLIVEIDGDLFDQFG